jgi:hypothetical protein
MNLALQHPSLLLLLLQVSQTLAAFNVWLFIGQLMAACQVVPCLLSSTKLAWSNE